MPSQPNKYLSCSRLVAVTVVEIKKKKKRYRDSDNILMVYLVDKYVSYYNISCFKTVDNKQYLLQCRQNEVDSRVFPDNNDNVIRTVQQIVTHQYSDLNNFQDPISGQILHFNVYEIPHLFRYYMMGDCIGSPSLHRTVTRKSIKIQLI